MKILTERKFTMLKKLFIILLSFILVLSLFSACGEDVSEQDEDIAQVDASTQPDEEPTEAKSEDSSTNNDEDPDNQPTEPVQNQNTAFGQVHPSVEYMGTIDQSIYSYNENGIIYRGNDGKKGIKSLDGSFDSGAIYYSADVKRDYFLVQTAEYTDPNDMNSINSSGLIDAYGNVIIPAQYALIKDLNDRFYRAYTVTERTEDRDNYLIYMTDGLFSLSADEDDILYTGHWCVYDIQTGEIVPDFTGTTGNSISISGDVLSYTENKQIIRKNANGQDFPQNVRMFENGSYVSPDENAVYDSTMNKLFDIDPKGYDPRTWTKDYYTMTNSNTDPVTYALADKNGNICSADFTTSINVIEGGLIGNKNGIYDFEGNLVLDKPYYMGYYYNGYWMIKIDADNLYIIDSNYDVLLSENLKESESYYFDSTYFALTKKENDTNYYYSVTKNDFVEGQVIGLGLAKRPLDDGNYELIDILTDTTILSGYSNYLIDNNKQDVRTIYARFDNNMYDSFILK